MKKLTVIIPYLNEPNNEVFETIKSMHETEDSSKFNIIAIDDCSVKSYDLSNFKNVTHIRNSTRKGVDGSRQLGVELSDSKYCLILDGHMRMRKDNWASKIIDYIDSNPHTLWCTTCLGLGYGTIDINKHLGKYYGADLKLFTLKEKDRPCRSIIEPVWASEKSNDEYEISCILGANYFFNKDWYMHIGGLKNLKSWGSSEPKLSICSYLAGGNCKITKQIEIGHVFRDNAPYTTPISSLVFNKVLLLKTIFPQELENKLMVHIPKDANYDAAMKMIEQEKGVIEQEKAYYKFIFKMSMYDLCTKFNIEIPK
jgi:glycosyltransferase involved in cell wall biosynthesis